jgi:uncharacterized protein YbjT (DUF2867 family)
VDRVFMIARPGDPEPERVAAPFVSAMARHGVRHVITLTAFGVERNTVSGLRRLEQLVETSGLSYTHLRPNFFMQIFLTPPLGSALLATDLLEVPADEARLSFIDARDIARAAARVLEAPYHHEQRAYTLTGPEALTHQEVAERLSAATERAFRYRSVSEPEARASLLRSGLSEQRVERVLGFYRLVRSGMASELSPDLAHLLGQKPTTFTEFARAHAELLRPARTLRT